MKHLQSHILLVFVLLSSVQTYSQHLLSGIVIDKSNNEPVPFANIVIENNARGIVSGLDGKFSLNRRYSDNMFKISCL